MNPHDLLKLAGGVLALAMYVPMILEIIRARGAGQSFATWGLWAVLDIILTITLWQQHGNYLLSLGFAVGGVALAVVLLAQGSWKWSRFETVIALMVLASLAVWQFSGPRNATIAVTTAATGGGQGLGGLHRGQPARLLRRHGDDRGGTPRSGGLHRPVRADGRGVLLETRHEGTGLICLDVDMSGRDCLNLSVAWLHNRTSTEQKR
jgi:hypothetical protein